MHVAKTKRSVACITLSFQKRELASDKEIEKTPVPPTIQSMASIEATWYGIILAAILSILQLIYKVGGHEPHFHLQTTVSLFASMSLISLTSFNHFPCPKQFKIPLFFSILASGAFLSATVPCELWLLPYLSCIRPLFDLLGDLYFLCRDFVIGHLLEFYKRNVKELNKRKIKEPNQLLLPINEASGSSSSAEGSFNSEGFMRSDEVL